jgi:adenosine deaminase
MKLGFRKLQFKGFSVRSHHGETWHTLKKGVQAVDNAMNIWHIDTLEHGLSLGINPNFYFHRLFIRVMERNQNKIPVDPKSADYRELVEMDWGKHHAIFLKLSKGETLTKIEQTLFLKVKFHVAREIEHYQHDVLNRMLQKDVGLVALPSSNNKLTNFFPDYKDHPFSWWEKKGVKLGIGTDNYVTLNTNYINEMLIILFTDPYNLKITKLLMVATGETRRPYVSQLLWRMREMFSFEA